MGARLRTELERRGFRVREPVGSFALLRLIQEAPFALPAGYLDLLRATNGGSGGLGSGAFHLIRAEQVLAEHRGFGVDEQAPGHLLFATDGEGSFFLLDEAGCVRRCASADVSEQARWRVVCERFDELLAALGAAREPADGRGAF